MLSFLFVPKRVMTQPTEQRLFRAKVLRIGRHLRSGKRAAAHQLLTTPTAEQRRRLYTENLTASAIKFRTALKSERVDSPCEGTGKRYDMAASPSHATPSLGAFAPPCFPRFNAGSSRSLDHRLNPPDRIPIGSPLMQRRPGKQRTVMRRVSRSTTHALIRIRRLET